LICQGYRHKKTGHLYHHAFTQTTAGLDRQKGWADGDREKKAHRDTQTYVTKTRSQMTSREYGTQMKRNDLLMDDSEDVGKVAKPYFSSSQLDELKRKKTLIIQCYWRGYVARKRTWNIREALYQDFIAEREALVKVRGRGSGGGGNLFGVPSWRCTASLSCSTAAVPARVLRASD